MDLKKIFSLTDEVYLIKNDRFHLVNWGQLAQSVAAKYWFFNPVVVVNLKWFKTI